MLYQNLTDQQHINLVAALCDFKGSAIVSTYESPIYAPPTEAGYKVHRFNTYCHTANKTRATATNGNAPRTEVVYRRIQQ